MRMLVHSLLVCSRIHSSTFNEHGLLDDRRKDEIVLISLKGVNLFLQKDASLQVIYNQLFILEPWASAENFIPEYAVGAPKDPNPRDGLGKPSGRQPFPWTGIPSPTFSPERGYAMVRTAEDSKPRKGRHETISPYPCRGS